MKYAFFLLTAVVSLNAASLFANDDATKNEPTTQTETGCEEGQDCADDQE